MVSVWMWIIPCTFHQGWRGTVSFLLSGGTGWESSCHISGQTRQKDCAGAFLPFPQLLQGWGDRSRSVQPPEPYHLGWRWHCWLRVFPRLLSGPGLPPSCRTHVQASGKLRGCFQCHTDINLKPSFCGWLAMASSSPFPCTTSEVVSGYGPVHICWNAGWETEQEGTLDSFPEPSGSREELTLFFS